MLKQEQSKVQLLEHTKEQLEEKERQVLRLKTQNSLDLLDFKVSVVGDQPDDWEEMKRMQA